MRKSDLDDAVAALTELLKPAAPTACATCSLSHVTSSRPARWLSLVQIKPSS